MIPGTQLEREAAVRVFKAIEEQLGSSTAADWQPVSPASVAADIGRLSADEYFVYYRHPVHEFKDWCSRAPKSEVLELILREFDKDRGEGVDVYLAPLGLGAVFVGNHDGELFRAK